MYLPLETYKIIVESVPILCVDGIIMNEKGEYLLVKRVNRPLKGEWWVPGGRVEKHETLEGALHRKIKQETGLKIKIIYPIGYYEEQYKESTFPNIDTHTMSVAFVALTLSNRIKLDGQSSSYKWSKELPKKFIIKKFELNGNN